MQLPISRSRRYTVNVVVIVTACITDCVLGGVPNGELSAIATTDVTRVAVTHESLAAGDAVTSADTADGPTRMVPVPVPSSRVGQSQATPRSTGSPLGTTYSLEPFVGADVDNSGSITCFDIGQGVRDYIVPFDEGLDLIDAIQPHGASPLVIETETVVSPGISVIQIAAFMQAEDLYPGGHFDGATGTPLTDACFFIGLTDLLDWTPQPIVVDAELTLHDFVGGIVDQGIVTPYFSQPWSGFFGVASLDSAGAQTKTAQLSLTVITSDERACTDLAGNCLGDLEPTACANSGGFSHTTATCGAFSPHLPSVAAQTTPCEFDNGDVLDGFVIPASQYEPDAAATLATADDFVIPESPRSVCDITNITAYVRYFNIAQGHTPDPNLDFQGINVTIYADSNGAPAGESLNDGSHVATFPGGILYSDTLSSFTVSTIGSTPCLAANDGVATPAQFRIDIAIAPEMIRVPSGKRLWLEVQPIMNRGNIGQTALLLAQESFGYHAKQLFPKAGLTDWTTIYGNNGICDGLAPRTRRDLALTITAQPAACDSPTAADCNANGVADYCDVSEVPGMFWASDAAEDNVFRANLDGSGMTSIASNGLVAPKAVAIDPIGRRVYWSDLGTSRIQSADLDGTNVQDVVTLVPIVDDLAIDASAGKLYWSGPNNSIFRADLDGANAAAVVTGLPNPNAVAVDTLHGKLYWTDLSERTIGRANLDGTNPMTVLDLNTCGVCGAIANAYALDIDPDAGKLYWTNDLANTIQRSNLNGSEIETLVTGLNSPRGFVLDVAAGKLYWTDSGFDHIRRADLDGSNIETIITSTDNPAGIDLWVFPSSDCDGNGVPDECEPDCDADGEIDACELAFGTSLDCDGNGVPDECEADCNANHVADACDITGGTSADCQGDGVPDECQLPGATATLLITEVDVNAPDALEIQNVSGRTLDTLGWSVAVSHSPYSDLSTVNSIVQPLPAHMLPGEIIYWTDSNSDNYWGGNIFWNPGSYPLFSGWAIILDDNGTVVDFVTWGDAPEATIQDVTLDINSHNVFIGGAWFGDGLLATNGFSEPAITLQRQGDVDHNDASDWAAISSTVGTSNAGLAASLELGDQTDCNANDIPDDCDLAQGLLYDCNTNGILDDCELANHDCDSNGRPDDCDTLHLTHNCCIPFDGFNPLWCEDTAIRDCVREADQVGICDFSWPASCVDLIESAGCSVCPSGIDCNDNQIPDTCELADNDCNDNQLPDECDIGPVSHNCCEPHGGLGCSDPQIESCVSIYLPACTANGPFGGWGFACVDAVSIYGCGFCPGSDDCDDNQVPDECDIASGSASDCDEDGLLDGLCEEMFDCNGNGVSDECDIAGGTSHDCNEDNEPDECTLLSPKAIFLGTDTVLNGRVARWDANDATWGDIATDVIIGPSGLYLDIANQKIYWSLSPSEGDATIHRGNLDGSNVEDLFTLSEAFYPQNLTADPSANELFWISQDSIYSSGFDGSNIQEVFTADGSNCTIDSDWVRGSSLTVNRRDDHLYWVDNFIYRVPTNGGTCEVVAAQTTGFIATAMTIDAYTQELYFCERSDASQTARIARLKLDGSEHQPLISIDYNNEILSMAIDQPTRRLYWSDYDAIWRANLDGSGIEKVVERLILPRFIQIESSLVDCNGNGYPDECDIADCMGDAACGDCNGNGIPDDCDFIVDDCNSNGVADACELAFGSAADCDSNGILDSCDPDCDSNGVPDACDTEIVDCNGNQIPDGCELAAGDCNHNASPDDCDIAAGTSLDTSSNGIPDECEFVDCNENGIDDGVELLGATKVYWTNNGPDDIVRADPDGGNLEVLVSIGLSTPDFIAIDHDDQKIYWTDRGVDKIQRANLDGTDIEDLITSGLSGPAGIAVDHAAGKLYWADNEAAKIQRSNLDGSGVEDVIASGLSSPIGLALDLNAGKMYWGDQGTLILERANLDGTEIETVVSSGLVDPRGIALNIGAGTMYCVDNGDGTIKRASLDGGGVEILIAGLSQPLGIAVDLNTGKIYWADSGSDRIQRANIDGTDIEDVYAPGTNVNPRGVAISLGAADCNTNGVPDDCDAVGNDCNSNGIPDDCELMIHDANDNGILDDCETIGDGDFDGDGDVDIDDVIGCLQGIGGPNTPPSVPPASVELYLSACDVDDDGDLDLADFAILDEIASIS
ncbi:MAG: hypothetical protein H6817_02620 [Phycisphaerales bacterium]|nr:hypothetical protein [Phycisphaerales bacterium]